MEQGKIARINELARKAKSVGLTAAEMEERARLREEYVAAVRNSLQAQLEHTIVVEPDGSRHPLLTRKEKT